MFIVNQQGTECVELNSVKYNLDYDDRTLDKLESIYHDMSNNVYYHGSTANCLQRIKEEQYRYTMCNNCKKILRIYVNGNLFGKYESVDVGKSTFESILDALDRDAKLYRLDELIR